MAQDRSSKHAFGQKEKVEEALEAGTINSFDILHLDNGETGWINGEGNVVLATPRTQKEYRLNGTDFGALKDGDTIPAGKSLDEIMNMATQKAIKATYSKPTVAIANNGGQASGNVEAGSTITPKLRATFTKNDAGDLTSIEVLKGGSSVGNNATSPYNYEEKAFVIGDETVTFTAKATYKEGAIKNNNLGQPSPEGHITAGNVTSSAYNISGKRKAFWGAGLGATPELNSDVIRGLANNRLNIANGVIDFVATSGNQHIIVALPKGKKLTKVFSVEMNNDLFPNFTNVTVQVADARGEANGLTDYSVWHYQMSTPAPSDMTLKLTIA